MGAFGDFGPLNVIVPWRLIPMLVSRLYLNTQADEISKNLSAANAFTRLQNAKSFWVLL